MQIFVNGKEITLNKNLYHEFRREFPARGNETYLGSQRFYKDYKIGDYKKAQHGVMGLLAINAALNTVSPRDIAAAKAGENEQVNECYQKELAALMRKKEKVSLVKGNGGAFFLAMLAGFAVGVIPGISVLGFQLANFLFPREKYAYEIVITKESVKNKRPSLNQNKQTVDIRKEVVVGPEPLHNEKSPSLSFKQRLHRIDRDYDLKAVKENTLGLLILGGLAYGLAFTVVLFTVANPWVAPLAAVIAVASGIYVKATERGSWDKTKDEDLVFKFAAPKPAADADAEPNTPDNGFKPPPKPARAANSPPAMKMPSIGKGPEEPKKGPELNGPQ